MNLVVLQENNRVTVSGTNWCVHVVTTAHVQCVVLIPYCPTDMYRDEDGSRTGLSYAFSSLSSISTAL